MMKLRLKIKPNRKQLRLKLPDRFSSGVDFIVSLTERKEENRANRQLIAFLEDLTSSRASIVAGATSTEKLVEIDGGEEIREKLGRVAEKRK